MLIGLGDAFRLVLGIDGGIDTSSVAYGDGNAVAFGLGVARMGYDIAIKGYSLIAESGASASAFRSSLRMAGAPSRDLSKYPTDAALRAAAGRSNSNVNGWGAGVTAAAATAGCR